MPGSGGHSGGTPGPGPRVDSKARDYIDAIRAEHRPLFDRIQQLIFRAHPDATVVLAYGMPTYRVGESRVHVGVWRHGVSIYGWRQDDDGGFVARHPALKTSTGTIRIRPADAADITDDEFLQLLEPALASAD